VRGNTRVKQAVDNGLLDPLFVACREYEPRIAEWTARWYREQERHAAYGMAVALDVLECRASPDTVGMFVEDAAPGGPTSP
jgi:hypothetical protein